MITPITLSPFRLTHKACTPNHRKDIAQNNNIPQYFSNNINFAQLYNQPQIKFAGRFQQTIDSNFFQLPKITLKNGQQYQLQPDKNQRQGALELYNGRNLLYCVSTGSGKTAVAHWVMTRNLQDNKKSIYTVPVKALANDKYDEFCEIYGEDKVGILTGDVKRNPNAPIVIMTTEIYDKQIESDYFNSNSIGTVIYDEAHYIDDDERGHAWENSIIKSSEKNIQMLLLSATIGNSEEFKGWIASLNPQRETKKVEINPQDRFVPQLYYHYLNRSFKPLIDGTINLIEPLTERQKRGIEIIYKAKEGKDIDYAATEEDLQQTLEELKENVKKHHFSPKKLELEEIRTTLKESYEYLDDDQKEAVINFLLSAKDRIIKGFHSPTDEKDYPELIEDMKINNMLPAIVYRLSKGKCEQTAREIAGAEKLDLTTEKEKEQIKTIIDAYKKKDGKYLGMFSNKEEQKLLNGVGTHHSSRAPEYKALVEELFRRKLLKVVVATSTLGVGIDMPAKSTVISDITYREVDPIAQKNNYKPVSANEFFQMIGRAGRRGQDAVGNVIIYQPSSSNVINEEQIIKEYLVAKPDDLNSSFKPSVTSLAQYFTEHTTTDELRDIIDKSFKVYLSENQEHEKATLMKDYSICINRLTNKGYLNRTYDNKIQITPKGKILALSQCSNPLMLASVLYNETLENATVEQICQTAGYIAGSETAPKIDQAADFEQMLKNRIIGIQNRIDAERDNSVFDSNTGYESAKAAFENLERTQSSSAVFENDKNIEGIGFSNPLSGFITYCWAILNKYRPDSIENFDNILNSNKYGDPTTEKGKLPNIFRSNAAEGDCYKIIAQTVSILKQMNYICDYAIGNEYDFPNTEYWQSVKEKTQQAIQLMNKPPISEFNEPESEAISAVKNMPVNICPICEKPMTGGYEAQAYARKMLYLSGKNAYKYIQNGIDKSILFPMRIEKKKDLIFIPDEIAQEALRKIQELTKEDAYSSINVRTVIKILAEQYSEEARSKIADTLAEIEGLIEERVRNKTQHDKLITTLDKALDDVINQPVEKFRKDNLDREIRNIINKLASKHSGRKDLQEQDEDLYDKIKTLIEKIPSSENSVGAFFIYLNNQPDEKIASTFTNKRYSTATHISPYGSEDYDKTANHIKICSPCNIERGTTKFRDWIKHIPNHTQKLQSYIEQIKNAALKNPKKRQIYTDYATELQSKLNEALNENI